MAERTEAQNIDDLEHSIVGGSLATEHTPGTNILWCSTFQLVWNELMDRLGGPVELNRTVALADDLNAPRGDRGDLDPTSYVAMSGTGAENILARITAELDAVFKGEAKPTMLPASVGPNDWLGYAYLLKQLNFATPFAPDAEEIRFGKQPVASFGIAKHDAKWHERAAQVEVLSYVGRNNFVVELHTTDPDDRLIIARTAPGVTLEQTVQRALSAPPADNPSLTTRDKFAVPDIELWVKRQYSELIGHAVVNWPGQTIGEALQDIKFTLNKDGAKLKSEAMMMLEFAAAMPQRGRDLIVDGPFVVMLMRKGATLPYFAAWIEHPELLVQKAIGPPGRDLS